MVIRCEWAKGSPLEMAYHDEEWGVPVRDDRLLFEFLCLEGAQAGLSWSTILKKRKNYLKAFEKFDPKKVAGFDERRIDRLLKDPGIVRNRLKVASAVSNARMVLEIQKEFGSFSEYIWQFVGGQPVQNAWKSLKDVPPETKVSQKMSKDMKKLGFRFIGPTVCYAFMQAVGMVNDHVVGCFRYRQVKKLI